MTIECVSNQATWTTNEKIVLQVLQELLAAGVQDVCVCPSSRNAPFVTAIEKAGVFTQYFWPEERSASFFALGRSKLTGKPSVVLTTSGTAVGELLPAAMEAYYTGIPLILLTADRPRRYRGTGAPQAAEQVGIFGQYAVHAVDIAEQEGCSLENWEQNGPLHLNVCLDEPLNQSFDQLPKLSEQRLYDKNSLHSEQAFEALDYFLKTKQNPFVVVSAIPEKSRQAIIDFLLSYEAPVYLEGVSGLREDQRLSSLRVMRTDAIWEAARKSGYSIDGILRIGGIPTFRTWRDLEKLQGQVDVCSISEQPFSGLSWNPNHHQTSLNAFFSAYKVKNRVNRSCSSWIAEDRLYAHCLLELLQEEPHSEPALINALSQQIPSHSLIYLGNSSPIREWDAYASSEISHQNVFANRGVNGIDGQLSTFLGMCAPHRQNWGIVGDLTTIYDLAAPWVLDQMKEIGISLVVINNGGGKIFSRMYSNKKMQNLHQIQFKFLAELWKIGYEYYTKLPSFLPYDGHRLIEIVPDEEATMRFWDRRQTI